MRKLTWTLFLVVALVGTVVLGGCTASSPAAPTTGAAPAGATAAPAQGAGERTEIVVGGVNALTGDAAGFGTGDAWGVKAAVEDINALGGVMVKDLGKKLPIRLVQVDHQSNPNKAGTLAEDLILREKVDFIVRGLEPPMFGAPIATIAEKHGVPHICGVGPYEAWMSLRQEANPVWKHTWTTSFAIATPAEEGDYRAGQSGYTMMDAYTSGLKNIESKTNKKVAAMASDDADGRGWYKGFTPVMTEMGWTVDGADKEFGIVPVDTTDFSPLIKQWIANGDESLWVNCPGAMFGTMWRQAQTLGFKPKLVFASRAGLYYTDIKAWGGNLPNHITNEHFWDPNMEDCPGIGTTTTKSLDERWKKDTGQPTHTMMATGYMDIQVLVDAIERAGTLDREKVNEALAKTDLKTIYGRVVFDKDNFSRLPVSFAQWVKSDAAYGWDNPVVISTLPFLKSQAELVFPIEYE